MKKIMLVALVVAAAACGGKKSGSDCDAAIAKGIDNFGKSIKERAPNPQVVERMMSVMDKLKGVLIERCKTDNWAPEVVSCFNTVNNRKDMQGCQSKLTPEQSSKLTGEIAQVMMKEGGMGMGQRMPPGMPGHPEMLQGNGSGAPAAPGAPAGAAGGSADPSAAPAAPPATPPAAPPAAEGSAAAPAAGSAK